MEIGKLSAKVTADIQDYQKKMGQVSSTSEQTAITSEKSVNGIGSALVGVASVATAVASTIGVAFLAIAKSGIGVESQLETAEMGFKALLGSSEEAGAVIERIKKEAKATPFEMTGLVAGAQALTAITKDGNRSIDILLNVGKAVAVAGKGAGELDRVIMNLQQVASTGVVTEMDIRQFQGAIPVFNDVLALSGLTTQELKDSANSAELLFDAFEKFGTEGIGAQGFEAQAGTWQQLISNLGDTWDIFTSDFVRETGVFDIAKDVIGGLISIIEQASPYIIEFFNSFKNGSGEFMSSPFMQGALAVFTNIFEGAKAAIEEFWAIIQLVWGFVVDWWEAYLKPAIDELGVVMQEAFGIGGASGMQFKDVMAVVGRVVGLVLGGLVIALTVVITAIVKFITFSIQFGEVVVGVFNSVKNSAIAWKNALMGVWQGLVNGIASFTGKIISAITQPFYEARKIVSGIAQGIKDSLDKINPFHRESPSLIDNIKKGVGIIQDEYASLGNMNFQPVNHMLDTQGVGGSSGGLSVSINMAGANISSPEIAQEYAEKIGDAIIGRLRTNRRSYV